MNSWSTLAAPVRNLLAQMPPQWRYALLASGVACVVAVGWLWSQEDATADKPLFGGRVFVAAELRTAQGTLKQAGVNGLRVSGGRIFVPADQCARCESLLSHDANGKSSFGEHYEKALSQSAWPVSESHRQELMDSARANELIEMFKADPNIADARLMWNRAKRRTFSSEGRTTAVLGITPRAGKAVSPELAESLKTAVASAFGLATADDVTLIEHSPQGAKLVRTASAEQDDTLHAAGFRASDLRPPQELEPTAASVESELSQKLAWIPEVSIQITERESRSAGSKYFVTVEIPPAVTRSLAGRSPRSARPPAPGEKPRPTRIDLRRKVEQIVLKTLCLESGFSTKDVVRIVFRGETTGEPVFASETEVATQQIMAWLQTWPGALVGLATLLAIVCTLPRIARRGSSPEVPASDASSTGDADGRLTNDDADSRDSTADPANHHSPDDSGLDLTELAQNSVSLERGSTARADEQVPHAPREFAMLHDCSADEWRTLLRDEPPQAIAVILSRLPPAQSAFVLRLMPAGVRLDIVRRMATLDAPSPTVLAEFASVLEERLRTLRRSRLDAARDISADSTLPPSARVSEPSSPILETLGRDTSRRVAAPQSIPQAEFHDLRMLDDGSLRELFASFDLEHWAIALKGADDSIVTKLRDSLTSADALALQSALDQLGPVRLADVDAAQRAIAHELTPLRWRGRRTNRQRAMEETAT